MTGTGAAEFVGRVAVVEQAGRTVRVLLNEGETLYSVRDILIACGVKYPTKWCQRKRDAQSSVKLLKLLYPVNGKIGGASRQSCPMYFTNEPCGRMILDMVGCDKGVREWMEKEVFTFKIGRKELPRPPAEEKVAQPELPPMRTENNYLEKKIDEMLFSLLDLKKYIAQQRA